MPPPTRVLIFGAGGRIGSAVARCIAIAAPATELVLATSRPDGLNRMAGTLPQAHVVASDYFDRASLDRALAGVDAVFVVTPSWLDEQTAMGNLIGALLDAPKVRQVIRIVGDPPGMRLARIPQVLKEFGGGTATQHLVAREMLERSELPVTFLNVTSTYIDNFLRMAPQLRAGRWVLPRDRLIGYIDPTEVGEAAARILLSEDRRHIGQHYNLDNGEKPIRSSEAATIVSEVLGHPVRLIISEERFLAESGPALNARYGIDRGGEFMIEYLRFEEDNEVAWRQSDGLETLLGRKPITLRGWLERSRGLILGDASADG